jgi:hypothetical protein
VYGYTDGALNELLAENILNKAEQPAQQDTELVELDLLRIVDATWVEAKYYIEDDEDLEDEDEKKNDGQRCTLVPLNGYESDHRTLDPAKGNGQVLTDVEILNGVKKGELRIDGVLLGLRGTPTPTRQPTARPSLSLVATPCIYRQYRRALRPHAHAMPHFCAQPRAMRSFAFAKRIWQLEILGCWGLELRAQGSGRGRGWST